MPRVSTGKVKLRSTPNGMMFTIPKKIVDEAKLEAGDTFTCNYLHNPGTGLEIMFRRNLRFKVRLNNGQ